MPNALPLPDDLVDLHRVTAAAELAVSECCAMAQARRRELHPDDVIARASWDEEETAELGRLRDAYMEAALAVRAHPLWEQARAEGCHAQTWQALIDAVKESAAA
ncbi:hypothetical protein [Kitasatospora sp. NPDC001175]|uniref:hypothetical protein n=1 Tax=Kitasatospora sp. NPDC001175 TaxID=3157103 RepID=UPI003D06992E